MSTSTNVHPNTWKQDYMGEVRFIADLDSPAIVRLQYIDGGPTIAANHETTMFIGAFKANAVRRMATSAQTMTDALFARANELDAKEADDE